MYALVGFGPSSILLSFLKESQFSLANCLSGWGKDWRVNRVTIPNHGK